MYRIAHLSDLHATPVRVESLGHLLNKRMLGWLSWHVRRSKVHRPEVLSALVDDLGAAPPDHVVVTGDLTNVAGPGEFPEARRWLERIGAPADVSIVPGNHDAYVALPFAKSWAHWREYLVSDAAAADASGAPGSGAAGGDAAIAFPTLRERGPVAVVGVNTAVATLPFRATGRVGSSQLERLEALLTRLRTPGRFRLVLLHHPPTPGAVSPRRSLLDASELCGVLQRAGAELVLHGHMHRTRIVQIEGPGGPIPVVGVRSSSDVGSEPDKRAQYHLYEIEPSAQPGSGRQPFRVRMHVRGYDIASGRFAAEGEPRAL